MHIPDGYLSPSTCAAFYAGSAPFWYVALQRAKRELQSRTIPLLSIFSAFSFVVMMFNLPLPGGTTGHAVGMGMASIVLGPWISMLAISIALLIQALFFGDGGVTALGANCFNMAIVGSFAAFGIYWVVSRGADITARRRVFAAGIAGYVAINAAAFCAALEFGIQPLLFHDAAGVPLYAPYPMHVAIPAMLIGHLTFAGLAELVLSAGLVAYLQRADPALLLRTAPGATVSPLPENTVDYTRNWPSARRLCLIGSVFLLLTPLGIVAVGDAWGEWRARDFADPAARRAMAAASRNQAPPAAAPSGLARLSSIWKAPVSEYSPRFIRNPRFGYFLSAVMGVGLVLAVTLLVTRVLRSSWHAARSRRGFLEGTVASLLSAMEDAVFAETVAYSPGLLQACDARVKLVGLMALVLTSVAAHRLGVLATLLAVALLFAFVSQISLWVVTLRLWPAVLAFTGTIALPAIFLVPGRTLFHIGFLNWTATWQGLSSALFLILRAEAAATFCLLLVLSTRWNELLHALRFLRVPVSLVVIVASTYRFVFVLLQTTYNMFESRRARLVGVLDAPEQRRFAAAIAGVLLDKSLQLSSDVHAAMLARGFRGEALLLDDPRLARRDWLELAAFLTLACALWGVGR